MVPPTNSHVGNEAAAADDWPVRLKSQQDLQKNRGEVVLVGVTPYAIVGFDGREMCYLCWVADERGYFITSELFYIPMKKAHLLPGEPELEYMVPPLPDVDHMGHIKGMARGAQRSTARCRRSGTRTSAATSSSSTRAPTREVSRFDSRSAGQEQERAIKECVLCVLCRQFTDRTSQGIYVLVAFFLGWEMVPTLVGASQNQLGLQLVTDSEPRNRHVESDVDVGCVGPRDGPGVAQCSPPASLANSPSPQNRNCMNETLQIAVPIVKPSGWEEIQSMLQRMPLVFDERGSKESMTVRPCNWPSYVDRQKEKLARDIQDARTSGVDGSSDSAEASTAVLDEEDVADMVRMLDSMDDWKDLSRYQGKSISMASTLRGNEMKIQIMAFAEREDGAGIDFMRVQYRKSVEVRSRREWQNLVSSAPGSLKASIRSLLPFVSPPDVSPEEEMRWIRLLQQPDLAKFTIALAFKDALKADGVNLLFSEANFATN